MAPGNGVNNLEVPVSQDETNAITEEEEVTDPKANSEASEGTLFDDEPEVEKGQEQPRL